ncbi:hypothetical protein ACXZ66_11295 [Corynebacterium sp. S7]
MPNFASVLDRYKDLFRPVVAALSVVFALLSTIFTAMNSTAPDTSSVNARANGYVAPPYTQSQNLEQIRGDFFYAVLSLRADEPGIDPVAINLDLQRVAQLHAEGNAVTGNEANLDMSVAMVQHHLPIDQATGRSLLDAFLYSPEHTAVLLDSRHKNIGVGVAQGHENVWITVVFSQ